MTDLRVTSTEPEAVSIRVTSSDSSDTAVAVAGPSVRVVTVDGGVGPAGPPGPQGPPGAGGGSSRPALLSGGVPLARQIDPLDGVNDPYRWSPYLGSWLGPPVAVSWKAGDVVPALTAVPAGAWGLELFIGPYSALEDIYYLYPESFLRPQLQSDGSVTGDPSQVYEMRLDSSVAALIEAGQFVPNPDIFAPSDGTGIAFLLQNPPGGARTAVPDKTLDIATMLGDVTVTGPYAFPETVGDGEVGDFWIDTNTGNLYGPKQEANWGVPIARFTNPATQAYFPNGVGGPQGEFNSVALDGIGEPDDSEVWNSMVVQWHDLTTPGAPVIRFKSKDAEGNVYVASLPMTPR